MREAETKGSEDEYFMGEALKLARKGAGWVSPNPMVGAVLVRGGQIVAKGYHRRFGGPHAEAKALEKVEGGLGDATLYVTLEPCCHHGKTPPCAELIVRRRVGRLVVGVLDPNPQVSGRGVALLREAGVEVRVGVLEERCRALNRTFFHWMDRGLPWVTLKWAQSLDGRIATSMGHSQWISCETSRRKAHRLRGTHDAVLVGVDTVLRDDPQLTVRYGRGRNPIRIVLDTRLRIPLNAKVMELDEGEAQAWIVTGEPSDRRKQKIMEARGIRVLECPMGSAGRVDVTRLLEVLGQSGISSLLVEGGGRVLTSFLRAGSIQRLVCFVAPILLGKGVEAVGDLEIQSVNRAMQFATWRIQRSGRDVMVDALL